MSEEKSEIVKHSFSAEGNLTNYKSYGNKSLVENLQNAQASIEKMQYMERIWDRSRSQFMLKFLTCSQNDDWTRLRQIGAEMCSKRQALSEAKFNYMESQVKAKIKKQKWEEETDPLKKELLEIQAERFVAQNAELLIKFEGALKEIETLGEIHDQLKERIGDVSEEAFEKAEMIGHIKRAISQGVREVRERGYIGIGNQEYLEQIGVCVTTAQAEIRMYLETEKESGGSTEILHKFLDYFAEKYKGVVHQQGDFLGFSTEANKTLAYQPDPDQQKLKE
jgi:hypothetical protein